MGFKKKYFKYKKKYLSLKKKGGVLFLENDFNKKFIDNFENNFIKKTDESGKLNRIYISETFKFFRNQNYRIDYYFTYSERNKKHSLKIGIIYDDYYLVDVEFSDEYILPFDEIYKSDNPYDISKELFMKIYNKYEDFFDEVINYNELFESITIGGIKKNNFDRFRQIIKGSIKYVQVEVYDDLYSYKTNFYFDKVNNINLILRIKLFDRYVFSIKEEIKFNELLNKGQINDIEKKLINIIQKYISNNKKKIKKKLFINYFSIYKDLKFLLQEKKRLNEFEKILNEYKKNKLIFTHETNNPIKIFKSGYLTAFPSRLNNPISINTKLNLNDENNKNVFIHQASTNIFTQILEENPAEKLALWFYEYENIIDDFSYIKNTNIKINNKLKLDPPTFTKFRMILMIPRDDINTEYFVYFDRKNYEIEDEDENFKFDEINTNKSLPNIEFIDNNKERLINRLIDSNIIKFSAKNRNEIEKNIYKISSKVARSQPGTITQFDVSLNYVKLIIADISMKETIDNNFELFKNFNIVYTKNSIIDYK